MFQALLEVLATIGVGLASALVPLVNAEALSVASGVVTSVPGALITAVALAAGQTAGKVAIFYGAQSVRRKAERRNLTLPAARRTRQPLPAAIVGQHARPHAHPKLARVKARLARTFENRRSGAAVTLSSASIGLPPLLLVTAAAGAARMRVADFAACCFAGRAARFIAIAVPIAIAMN